MKILYHNIFFDRNKRLWVGNEHGYLFRFDAVRDTLLPERDGHNKHGRYLLL